MNKPEGYVCAAASDSHKTVYQLLPPELQTLVKEAPRGCRLHTVGRLDCDTSGLLLITNDGTFSHTIVSSKIFKSYRARLAVPLSAGEQKEYIARAAAGLVLPPEKKYGEQKALPASLIFEASDVCSITVCEGKFHEVRRIFRALGNEVLALERIAIGSLQLPADLKPGLWRELTKAERDSLYSHPQDC